MISAAARKRRAGIAVAARRGTPDQLAAARRDFWAQRLADFIADTLAKSPPMTAEQLDGAAAILDAAPRCCETARSGR